MDQNLTALERAFALAESGTCATLTDILNKLKAEGYSREQVSGPRLAKQLRALMAAAQV